VTQGISATAGAMPTTGRWGWYQDHDGAIYRRTSTLVKEVETDNHNLDKWKQRQVLIGAARRGDLVTAVKAMGAPDPMTGWTRDQKKLLDELVDKAGEAAKDTDGAITGTAVHTMTERIDRGEPVAQVAEGLPAAVAQGLRSYAALRELNGWRSVEIERTVVLDQLEVAGTFDRVDYLPELAALLGPGVCQHGDECPDVGLHGGDLPVIVDVKTEKDPTLNGLHIGPQLAIYSRARRMWRPTGGAHPLMRNGEVVRYPSGDVIMVPNGEYVPAPCVRQDVAVVVHVFNGDANPLLLNLAEGWGAAVAAHEQMQRKTRAKRKVGAAGAWFAPLPTKRPSRLTSFVETAAAARYADPNRPAAGEVGEQVTVGGVDFTRKVAAADAGTVATAQPISDGSTRYSVDVVEGAPTPDGWKTHEAAGPVRAEVAVRDPATGIVTWKPDPAPTTAPPAPATEPVDELAETRKQLIAAIWQARTVDALAILWKMAQDRGVHWSGAVAMAGDSRRRQIECGQRALHAGSGKCACGWMAGQVA
jgi:hypothetical protein